MELSLEPILVRPPFLNLDPDPFPIPLEGDIASLSKMAEPRTHGGLLETHDLGDGTGVNQPTAGAIGNGEQKE